jgi:hypothetical protein
VNPSGVAISPPTGYTGGGLSQPEGIAIDASGNAWVANSGYLWTGMGSIGSVTEFSSSGKPVSPSTGYTGGGLGLPLGIAIDVSSNVWVTNSYSHRFGFGGSVTKLSSSGRPISPSNGYSSGVLGVYFGGSIAVDASGDVWTVNCGFKCSGRGNDGSVIKLRSSGKRISPSTGYTGRRSLNLPWSVAIDPSGNGWVTNNWDASVSELRSSGKPISPRTGYTGGGLQFSRDIAVDASGDVWVANSGIGIMFSDNDKMGTVTEFIGAARPVLTPLVACLKQKPPKAVCLP